MNKITVIVNAIPLANVATGIGRYLRSLYQTLESHFSDQFRFTYFDGSRVLSEMPTPSSDPSTFSFLADSFWKLPPRLALTIRLAIQAKRQAAFNKAAAEADVYHEAGFFPFSSKLPTVFTIHDTSILVHPEWHPKERVLFMNRHLRSRSHKANTILTVSQFSKSEIIHHLDIPPGLIRVTPLAVDKKLFKRTSQTSAKQVLKKYNIPDRYFLFVGSGDPRKNADIIPQALDHAKLDIPLVYAGWKGWQNTTDARNIISVSYVPDKELPALYSEALALIFPSSYEGFGLPVLEAMACGCPVLTTDTTSLPEVGGNAALYVNDPRDPQEMGEKLIQLSSDMQLREELRHRGLEQVDEFSWHECARQTAEALAATAKGGDN